MNREQQLAYDNQAEDDDEAYQERRERLREARWAREELECGDLNVP